jgi:hypothetical protein
MKTLTKAALGAMTVALISAGAAGEANAAVSFGIGIGGPAYYGGGYYGRRAPVRPYYDPCYRPYGPGYCRYPTYRGPVFFNGGWRTGPYHYRYGRFGRPEFYFRGGWHGGRFRHR